MREYTQFSKFTGQNQENTLSGIHQPMNVDYLQRKSCFGIYHDYISSVLSDCRQKSR